MGVILCSHLVGETESFNVTFYVQISAVFMHLNSMDVFNCKKVISKWAADDKATKAEKMTRQSKQMAIHHRRERKFLDPTLTTSVLNPPHANIMNSVIIVNIIYHCLMDLYLGYGYFKL